VSAAPARFISSPGARVGGDIEVPGDKSISHRAAMLAALAEGTSAITGFLEGADCRATLNALGAMGVGIERTAPGALRIRGAGMRGLRAPAGPLDLGNSGTAMRLLAGILAGQPFNATLVGDASLMGRPMERVAAPLRRMGADVRTDGGRPPLIIAGPHELRGCDHCLEVASAQVKSALLFAGLFASGRTGVREPGVSRDHTERMLEAFGVPVERAECAVAVTGPATMRATDIDVPGDFSSAAFFLVAGLVAGAGRLRIRNVGINPTRTALLDILREMGADIRVHATAVASGEPRADIEVHPSVLHGVVVRPEQVPAAIDEMPVLFAAAAVADGETVVTGAGELRVKESDRLAAMSEGLAAVGVAVESLPDGLRIRGGPVSGGRVDSHDDHRVAMAFAVLGARARSPIAIDAVQNVGTSFPGFAATARACGLALAEAP
jgi:3-phosphoshikimate 1-carboxyvinyltransferase